MCIVASLFFAKVLHPLAGSFRILWKNMLNGCRSEIFPFRLVLVFVFKKHQERIGVSSAVYLWLDICHKYMFIKWIISLSVKYIGGFSRLFYQVDDTIQVVDAIRWAFATYCICNVFTGYLLWKFKKPIVSKFSSIRQNDRNPIGRRHTLDEDSYQRTILGIFIACQVDQLVVILIRPKDIVEKILFPVWFFLL